MSEKIKILNLSNALPEGLSQIFLKISGTVIQRGEAVDYEELDYIVVDSEEEASLAEKDYDTLGNDITLVCLGQVKEMKKFMLGNGRLCFEPGLVSSELGQALLSNFFKQECNLHLNEAYSGLFESTETFKVTNHLAIGSSLDELSLAAFDSGFNIVSLRSFLDHIIMYFTYLKQAGLAGIPFEVEYSQSKKYFAVNIHASVKNFVADYMVDSFGAVNSSDPLRYLLAVSSRSADFMDITFLENPGKVVINGFWSSNESGQIGGVSLRNIKTASTINANIERSLSEYKTSGEVEEASRSRSEKLNERSLPGGILEMVIDGVDPESILAKQPEETSKLIAFVIGHFEEVNPDSILSEMTKEDLKKALKNYPNTEFINVLNEDDTEALLEKVHKKNISEAYEEELERVRSDLEEEDDFKKELSDTLSEEVVKRVSSKIDADTIRKILGGGSEKEFSQTVAGGEREDEFKATVKGMKDVHSKEFAQRIAGQIEKNLDDYSVTISGSSDDEKGAFKFVSMAMSGLDSLEIEPRAKKFLKEKGSKKIYGLLNDFSSSIGKKTSDLSPEELKTFAGNKVLPGVEELLSDDLEIEDFLEETRDALKVDKSRGLLTNASPEFKDAFRTKVEQKIHASKGLEFPKNLDEFTPEVIEQDGFQQVIQDSMREAINEQFQLEKANRKEIDNKEKQIIKALSETFSKQEDEVECLVKGAGERAKEKEAKKVVENLFSEAPSETEGKSIKDSKFLELLKKANEENKKLSSSNKALLAKIQAYEQDQGTISRIEQELKAEVSQESLSGLDENEVFGVEIKTEDVDSQAIEDLKKGKTLSPETIQSLARLVKREKNVLESAKLAQENFKRAEIEHVKRENKYKSEIHNASIESKSKDIAIQKIKEKVSSIVEKKQNEIVVYKKQVEALNQRLEGDQTTKLQVELKSLKSELESAQRTANLYKSKMSSLANSKEKPKSKDRSSELSAENRKLQRLKTQLENKLVAAEKQKNAIEAQFGKLKDQERKLRERASEAEEKTKEANDEISKLRSNEARLVAMAEKGMASDPKVEAEIDTLKSKNAQLEKSLKEVSKKLNSQGVKQSGAKEEKSTNEKRLERSVKKLNSELSKAQSELTDQKKQVVRYKSEVTGLKNKIKLLEKEVASKKGKSKKAA